MEQINGTFATFRGHRLECSPVWGSNWRVDTTDPVLGRKLKFMDCRARWSGRVPMTELTDFREVHLVGEVDGLRGPLTHENEHEYVFERWERSSWQDSLNRFTWIRDLSETYRARIPKREVANVRGHQWSGTLGPATTPFLERCDGPMGSQWQTDSPFPFTGYRGRYYLWQGQPVVQADGFDPGELITIATEDAGVAKAHGFSPHPNQFRPGVFVKAVPWSEVLRIWDFWVAHTLWSRFELAGHSHTYYLERDGMKGPWGLERVPKGSVRRIEGFRIAWTYSMLTR